MYFSTSSPIVGAARRAAFSPATSSPSRTRARISLAALRAESGGNLAIDPSVTRLFAARGPPPCGRYSTIQLFAPAGVTRHPKPESSLSYAMYDFARVGNLSIVRLLNL